MSNVLVTGGAGFIGSNFVHYWHRTHPEDSIVVLDLFTYAGNRASLGMLENSERVSICVGDICDGDLVAGLLREHTIDTIVHFAAESHVDRSIHGPEEFIRSNVLGTHTLLACARKVWNKEDGHSTRRFHHVSTDEVYGSLTPTDPPFVESTRYAPNSPYAASKAGSDHLVRAYHKTYGLPVTVTNCSNNYGPFQFPEKLMPLMLVNILEGKPLPVYGDGSNIRDWLYVEDHCRAIDMVLSQGVSGEIYNVGGCNEISNIDVVTFICNAVDDRFAAQPTLAAAFPDAPPAHGKSSSSLIAYVKDRAGHDWRYAIDASKIERELNFAPVETFATGMAKTLDWYFENEHWWRGVMDGSYRDWVATNYEKDRGP